MASSSAPKPISILLVDNIQEHVEQICGMLTDAGYLVNTVNAYDRAVRQLNNSFFDLVLLSWQIPSAEQLALKLFNGFHDTDLVVMSVEAEPGEAVQAMRLGAYDYVHKNGCRDNILAAVNRCLGIQGANASRGERKPISKKNFDMHNFVGRSQAMQDVFRLINKVAATDATILVMGESGTGKELAARAIHHLSRRNKKPLIPVNCGAIPEDLLESELFGHERGAFTGAVKNRLGRFELAEGGTVFLDEIAEMSPMLQVKLLRVLQDHCFERIGGVRTLDADIRIIAATNQVLKKVVRQGRFREDLYYRLNVVPISLPPLRERKSDIPLLCEHFLEQFSNRPGMGRLHLRPEPLEVLMSYDWPGNVRELENLLERMVVLADDSELRTEDLPSYLMAKSGAGVDSPSPRARLISLEVPEDGLDFKAQVDAYERVLITQALERTGWVKNQAAALLRLNRTTLVEKIKKKGLTRPIANS
jgi:DNA-binding NtrC family response regulator